MEDLKEKLDTNKTEEKKEDSFASPFLSEINNEKEKFVSANNEIDNDMPTQKQPDKIEKPPVIKKIEKKWPRKRVLRSVIILISLIIISAVVVIGSRVVKNYIDAKNNKNQNDQASDEIKKTNIENENIIKSEESPAEQKVVDGGAVLSSENYRIRKINIGGDIVIMADNSENKPVEIYSVRNEMFTTRDGKEVKLLIYWRTNKLTISEIKYEKLSGGNPETKIEKDYDINHSVVIADLNLNTTYVYSVKAKDRWGNEIISDQYSVYTGALPTSIFELIGREFGKIFKWATKN